jgi:hypothetical protein
MHSPLIKTMLLLAPLALSADIFMRSPRGAESVLNELGGAKVYSSAVEINGRKGTMASYTFGETSDIVAARLARKLKLPSPKSSGAIILSVTGKTLARYFVFQAPALKNNALVTVLEQKSSVFSRTPSGDPPWPDNIPVFNATAKFSAYSEETRTTFLSAVSNSATPAQAADEASEALTQEGWEEMRPSTPTFRILVQGSRQRVVFAGENSKSREITINILQREGSRQ